MAKDLEAKQKAREERNKAQAIEEQSIWKDVNAQADQAVTIAKRKRGPLTTYTDDIGNEIVTRLANGQSLHSICKLEHMPHVSTIYDWMGKNPVFAERYGRGRESAAHTLFDQMIDIADDTANDMLEDGTPNHAAIARAKLQIDTRARVVAKLHPRVYGERVEAIAQTVNVTNNSLTIDGRSLGMEQRENLRTMLLQAREQIENKA